MVSANSFIFNNFKSFKILFNKEITYIGTFVYFVFLNLLIFFLNFILDTILIFIVYFHLCNVFLIKFSI